MRANDFLEMQRQDIETHKDKVILSEVVAAMAEVLKYEPNVEIDHKKTAEECYKQMYEFARKNATASAYVFTTSGTFEFIRKYLGLPEQTSANTVQVEKKRRDLEEFF